MRILLLGKTGQLGWELNRSLATIGEVISTGYPDINFTKVKALKSFTLDTQPNIIVNAAAYTAVDKAEQEPQVADTINGLAPGALAESARELGAVLIHYSTDYVFDGKSNRPYIETDTTNPISAYGRSKLLGEQAIEAAGCNYLILRPSWMYSWRRQNYLKKVVKWARNNAVLRIVTDQVGNPTSARFLAQITAQMLLHGGQDIIGWCQQNRGIYHLAGDGFTSRFEFTQEILRLDPHPEEHIFDELIPAVSADFPLPAQRPAYSALDCSKFSERFGLCLPNWKDALCMFMQEFAHAD